MPKFRCRVSPLCIAVVVAAASLARADSLLRPVPTPDTSRLAPEAAKQLAAQRGQIDAAKADLIGPPLAQAYADLGALYARNGFDEAAAVAFYDASQVSPGDGRWYYLRGVIARKLKRNDEARTNFQAALERDKVYLPIRYRLADTLLDLGDQAGARNVLEEAARTYSNQPATFAMLGQLALKQKRYADAVSNINQALKLDPKATELYAHLADAYAGQGNAKAAEEARGKAGKVTIALDDPLALGLSADSAAARGAAAAVAGTPLEQAQTLARQGRIPAARDKLAEVLEKNPGDVDALALAARIEAAMGNQAIAQADIDQALQAKADSAVVYLTSGVVDEYGGDEKKAYDDYRRAQRLDPKLPDTWLLLGNAEMRRTRYAQAAEQYRGLLALQPDSATAHAHLTAALVAQGKCGEALDAINATLARRKDDGDLMQLFVRVASTCAAANAKTRDVALDYGQLLYKQLPDAGNSSALALALAAHGKYKEAQEYQAQAIFEATRARDAQAVALYKSTMQQFVKQQTPDRPWPADHAWFKAPRLAAAAPETVAAPAK